MFCTCGHLWEEHKHWGGDDYWVCQVDGCECDDFTEDTSKKQQAERN